MIKVKANLEMDTDTYRSVLRCIDLLNAKINFDRELSSKCPVAIHEDYFIRQAVQIFLEYLENDLNTENFN